MSSSFPAAVNVADAGEEERAVVLLAGNPNSGKTTLFNLLTGARAKVSNYPGVTVDRLSGEVPLDAGRTIELVDLPGTYSLSSRSKEEQVAVDTLLAMTPRPDAVLVALDATTLSRGLYLTLQILETGLPTVIALTMMDEARAAGTHIDTARLSERLGARVVPVVAARGEGREALIEALEIALLTRTAGRPTRFAEHIERDICEIEAVIERTSRSLSPAARRTRATWALLSLSDRGDDTHSTPELREAVARVRERARNEKRDIDEELIAARYSTIDALVEETVQTTSPAARKHGDRIDAVLTHRVWGFVVFAAVMAVVFESLFSGSEPMVGLIERAIGIVQNRVGATLPDGPFRALVTEGVLAGVGNVIVFVPQIALLFFFIGILEDTGYLARVAFVIDRLMGAVGLHGRAFVPMLSGFACAIPAVMATRTVENSRDRLLTMMVLPLMSCSARLPVYVLVTATVFAPGVRVLGLSIGAVVLLSMYALSIVATLSAAAVLRRTVIRAPKPSLILELPPYRMPLWRNLLLSTWHRVRSFLVDAGTTILALTIVLWALLSYPKSNEISEHYDTARTGAVETLDGLAREQRLDTLNAQEAGQQLEFSIAGRLGKAMEPALEPLGFDWRIGIGILGAFAAREVFVSTLGIVFGVGDADESHRPLRDALRAARRADGSKLMTPLSGIALMVFFVLACQCMSTLAVIRREAGTWRWPLFVFSYMSALAYVVTLLVYQIGRALGLGGGGG